MHKIHIHKTGIESVNVTINNLVKANNFVEAQKIFNDVIAKESHTQLKPNATTYNEMIRVSIMKFNRINKYECLSVLCQAK
jgi:hypothetical protein